MYVLHRFLIDYDMAMLRALAQNRGVDLTTNRQTEATDQLAMALLEPFSIRVALARLSSQARRGLNRLLAAGGRMRAPQFARQYGAVRPMGPGRLERELPWQEPANATEELLYAGLIFRAFSAEQGAPGEFFFVPVDLAPLLPQDDLPSLGFPLEIVSPPARQDEAQPSLVHDLYVYLVYVQTHDVRPYADGRLGRKDLTALLARFTDRGERRLELMRHLAQRLGMVSRPDQCLRLDPQPVKRWLTSSPARQWATLQEAWRDDPTWNDLCRVPSLMCDEAGRWQNDPLSTRRAMLELLARVPPDAWWTVASFVAAVKEVDPDFQRPDGDYVGWYIRDAETRAYLSGFESWDRVEGAFLVDLLTGPLYWLGIVERAPLGAAIGADAACRLTESGARLLGLAPDTAEPLPSAPILIRPDFTVELPDAASLYTQFQVERFAEWEGAAPRRYRLTVSSVGRALTRGVRVEQILAFLRKSSQGPLPPNVVGHLEAWAQRDGQVDVEEVALVRTKSERAMQELRALPETRSLIGQQLSPTTALVRKQDLPRLYKALRSLGYLPPE
jgi:hypothetical protein